MLQTSLLDCFSGLRALYFPRERNTRTDLPRQFGISRNVLRSTPVELGITRFERLSGMGIPTNLPWEGAVRGVGDWGCRCLGERKRLLYTYFRHLNGVTVSHSCRASVHKVWETEGEWAFPQISSERQQSGASVMVPADQNLLLFKLFSSDSVV